MEGHLKSSRRLFIAVTFSAAEKKYLNALQVQLAQQLRLKQNTFIPEEKWHLTLHFLGDVAEEQVEPIKSKLKSYSSCLSFSIELSQVVGFPSHRNPRVIALAVDSNSSPLLDLYSQIKQGLTDLKLPTEERLFIPHISLFRNRNGFEPLQLFSVQPISIQVHQFVLFETELTPMGSVYQPVQFLKLA